MSFLTNSRSRTELVQHCSQIHANDNVYLDHAKNRKNCESVEKNKQQLHPKDKICDNGNIDLRESQNHQNITNTHFSYLDDIENEESRSCLQSESEYDQETEIGHEFDEKITLEYLNIICDDFTSITKNTGTEEVKQEAVQDTHAESATKSKTESMY